MEFCKNAKLHNKTVLIEAIMSAILKSLKNYNDDTFTLSEHPIVDLDLENKVAYLYGLGLIMGSDEQIDESEKRFIGTLLRTLNLPDELLEEVEQNSQSIDEGFIEELKKTLTTNNLVSTFFYDAVMICYQDGNYCQTEKDVIKQLRYLLDFSDDDIFLVERTIEAIDSKNKAVLESIDGEGYWKWKHLVEYNRIDYTPESIKVSNYKDFKYLLDKEMYYTNIKLGEGEFWLSEADIEKLFSAKITGAGINKTTIWLEGEENCLFDEESPFNDHSHEITISMFNLKSISNCSVGTRHSKLLVLTICGGGDDIFNKCNLEDVSEIDSFEKSRLEMESTMKEIENFRELFTKF